MWKLNPKQGLTTRLHARADQLMKVAQADGEPPTEAALAELERWARLRAFQKPRRHFLWFTLGVVAFVLVVVSATYFNRLDKTFVSGEVVASELRFTLGSTEPLLVGDRLTELSFAGLDSVVLTVAPGRVETIHTHLLVVRRRPQPGALSTIDLAAVELPPGTLVRISAAGHPARYFWDLEHPEAKSRSLEHQVTISGAIVAETDHDTIRMQHDVGAPLTAYSSSPLTITTEYGDTTIREVPPIRIVHQLAFDKAFRSARAVSTIRGGTLSFDDLDGKEVTLGPGQALRLERTEFEVPYLALADNQIRVRLSGEVGGIQTGAGGRRNLMPRSLEYLRIHPAVVLISSVVITLVSYFLGVIGWLRRER